ncbi:retrovirus-related pol polyprotein from transposon TNT 1-94, partial [Trifolium medium]|nr:retrovirus-related pol polyprotein from transposon TNT 1-94 [Trifolium medium]
IAAPTAPSISQAQFDKLMSLLQNSTLNQASGSASSNQVGSSMVNDHTSVNHQGASHHICISLSWFRSYNEINPVNIKLPNGNFVIAKYSGTDQRTKKMTGFAEEFDGLYYIKLTDKIVHASAVDGSQFPTIPQQALWHF